MEKCQITFYLKNHKTKDIVIDATSLSDAQNYLHQVLPEYTSAYTFISIDDEKPFTISFFDIQFISYKAL